MATVTVFDPTATRPSEGQHPRRTLARLDGAVVGFIDNAKPNFDHLVDDVAVLLKRDFGVKLIVKHRKRVASIPASEEVMHDLKTRCDAVITGVGD